jgi:predicted aldo/keto reductase-like oxidoreductase
MKTAPGTVQMPPLDPENPTERYAKYIDRQVEAGEKREDVIKDLQDYIAETEKAFEDSKPFMEKHGISDREGLRLAAVKWVLANPEMHTVCMGFRDFDAIDRFLPLSGAKMARNEELALDRYRVAASSLYCRHACTDCAGACPHAIPVSTVMRYAYYFTEQGREKHAMTKYARLGIGDNPPCDGCSGPCAGACPYGVNIKANLMTAHGLLTLA